MKGDIDWIQVGELAKGFENGYMLPDNDDLVGKSIRLFFDNRDVVHVTFNDGHSLTWKVVNGPQNRESVETYRATCPRPGIYFVDVVQQLERATSISLVIDFDANFVTAVVGILPTEDQTRESIYQRATNNVQLSAVSVNFYSACIDSDFSPSENRHIVSSEMIGKRVKYVYSKTETYEHIYLNENLYTWHCLSGLEKGLADTDRCRHLKIAEDLYLLAWWEKIIPTLGVILIDLKAMKTTGKLFGYESHDFGRLRNVPVGAHATLLNLTSYDEPL